MNRTLDISSAACAHADNHGMGGTGHRVPGG